MSTVVVDTNVLIVANGTALQMSDCCRTRCIDRLALVRDGDRVVIDEQYFILREYQTNLNPNRNPPGPGEAFVKYLLQNMANPARVSLVKLTPTNREQTEFSEFPNDADLRQAFDPSDRKFVAASHAHFDKPPILEASDSKWLGWEAQLLTHGIRVEFLCRKELEDIRQRKSINA